MDGSKDKGVISPRLYVEPLFFNNFQQNTKHTWMHNNICRGRGWCNQALLSSERGVGN